MNKNNAESQNNSAPKIDLKNENNTPVKTTPKPKKELSKWIDDKKGKIGEVLSENLEIGCADLSIKVLEIQREGKQSQKIGQFMLGSKIKKGSNLQNE